MVLANLQCGSKTDGGMTRDSQRVTQTDLNSVTLKLSGRAVGGFLSRLMEQK